jgi:Gam-like protein
MPTKENEILNIQQVNQAMKELDKINSQLTKTIALEALAVVKARAKFHTGSPLKDREKLILRKIELMDAVEEYAGKDRKLWNKKQQSFKTPFGTFGFRKGQDCVALIKKTAKTFDAALALVIRGGIGFVRKVKELDKEKIIAARNNGLLTDELLAEVGLKVDKGEKFYIKTTSAKELKEALDKLKSA